MRIRPRWKDVCHAEKPYPQGSRDDVVTVAREGGWMKKADVEDGTVLAWLAAEPLLEAAGVISDH